MKNILIILFLFFLLMCKESQGAANYTLEIIQPQPALNTNNRFYKTYTGLEYNVRLAVIGGDYPFTYSLTTFPSGMTINTSTGEITWSNPVEAGSPHSVTAQVTDLESSTHSVSWTVTVDTTNAIFMDAVGGSGTGAGTIGDPFKTMDEMYEGSDAAAKTKDSYAFFFIYFKTGTYNTGDAFLENIDIPSGTGRMPLTSYDKPLVWLAYPGESPVLDLSQGYISIYAGADNVYFDGFEIINMTNYYRKGISTDPDDNTTFRRNTFHNLTTGGIGGSNNQSAINFGESVSTGTYYSVQDNEFYDINFGYAVLAYTITKALVEDNTLYDFTGAVPGIGPKASNTMWFIRANDLSDMADTRCIWLDNGNNDTTDQEVSYNLVNATGSVATLHVNQADPTTVGPIHIFRNTFIGTVEFKNMDSASHGPFNVYNNVIVNENTPVVTITGTNPERIVQVDNLNGNAADGILDANGNLTAAYISYLGIRGYQIPVIGISISAGISFGSGIKFGN